MRSSLLVLVPLVAVSVFAACGEEERPAGPGAGGSGGAGGGVASIGPIEWSACSLGATALECTEIDVPLDWSDPESGRISFFVRKYETKSEPRRGQLWFMQGGPGYGAEGFVKGARYFADLGFDVYMPDYRGMGRSTPLACEGEEDAGDVSPACTLEIGDRFGDGLRFFSSTGAALDIGKAIEAMRGDGDEIFVYGNSYGTYVANRYLTLFPDQADGAILDSICPPGGCSVHSERNLNRTANLVFDLCGADPECSARLSTDPWGRLADLLQRLVDGHCPAFAQGHGAEVLPQILLYTVDSRLLSPVALATTYRLDRCDPEDVSAVHTLVRQLTGSSSFGPADSAKYAAFAYWHILFSEFWDEGMTADELLAEADAQVVTTGQARLLVDRKAAWPIPSYRIPDELRRWADVTTPVLLLNGTLDARTPAADLAGIRDAFPHPGQTYVEVPFGGHGVMAEGVAEGGMGTCGFRMAATFIEDPVKGPDTSCLAGLETLDLEGGGVPSQLLFGTADLWENDVAAPAVRSVDPGFAGAFERAKERAAAAALGW